MYTVNKTNRILPLLLSMGIFAAACNKMAKINLPQEGTIYMPQAFNTNGNLSLVLVDTAQQVVFGAAYGGMKYPSNNITVSFSVDTSLVAAYNQSKGTAYTVLPSTSYTISALSSVIHSGQTSSDPLYLSIMTDKLGSTTPYILPITLTSTSTGTINPNLQTTYFTINSLNNIYAGSYQTTGTRYNFNADGTGAGSVSISDTRVLTTMSADSCSINTIANLGSYNGTVFYVRVNPDNTLEFSGYLSDNPASPIGNEPGKTSTWDPASRTFTVYYMYTNTNGTYRYMEEVWTPQ